VPHMNCNEPASYNNNPGNDRLRPRSRETGLRNWTRLCFSKKNVWCSHLAWIVIGI